MCSFGLPRPAPPRSESEGGSRGARAMVMPACLEPGDFSWFCGGSPRDDVERKGCVGLCVVGGLPGCLTRPPPRRVRLACPPRAAPSRASPSSPFPRRGHAVCVALRVVACAAAWWSRLAPPSPAAFPRLGTTGDLFPLLGAGDPGLAGSTSLSGACGLWGTTVGRPRRVAGRVGAHSRSRVFGGGGGVGSLPC